MALVYGVLGLIVILTAGTFGTINSSPWFNLGIAVLFVVLGLAMFDVLLIDFSKYSAGIGTGVEPRQLRTRVHDGRGRGAARRRVRRAGRDPGRPVLEQPLRDRDEDRARAAVLPRRRHGDPVADCRRRPRRAAEAGDVDGARQAGVRRLHPRDRGLLRLRGVLDLLESLGRSRRRSRRASRSS